MRRALVTALQSRPWLWLGVTAGFVAGYHASLLAAMMLRFGSAPNFVEVYDIVEAYRLTFAGTPALGDALAIAAAEPWLDVGFLSPQWKIAEWSLMILPIPFLMVVAAGALIATYVVVRSLGGGERACATPPGAGAMTAFGAALIGLANATLFWVVCCATPTWVVALAMLGLSASIALLVEPIGPWLTGAGLALLAGAIVVQLRHIAEPGVRAEAFSSARERSA